MAKYPTVQDQYYAILEGSEDQASLDCGCLLIQNDQTEATELYLCTMHNAAQAMLDLLSEVSSRNYVPAAGEHGWEALHRLVRQAEGGSYGLHHLPR
jgi:hypothetical protein